ncbi:hypothetical protein Y1Q_0023412 [Alligator mississippiensis]|uniref:Uncharacterized protein n=1 Tax=Alligator mississippiensis TaxID=8496 RepID=A0A151NPL1_ALLMI|nr:hypothetical protein Y1Q_0023412 [Alligator mississippiensis]
MENLEDDGKARQSPQNNCALLVRGEMHLQNILWDQICALLRSSAILRLDNSSQSVDPSLKEKTCILGLEMLMMDNSWIGCEGGIEACTGQGIKQGAHEWSNLLCSED